jgi:hypothetical protein
LDGASDQSARAADRYPVSGQFQIVKTAFFAQAIEICVHEQWSDAVNAPGQLWTGFRIL